MGNEAKCVFCDRPMPHRHCELCADATPNDRGTFEHPLCEACWRSPRLGTYLAAVSGSSTDAELAVEAAVQKAIQSLERSIRIQAFTTQIQVRYPRGRR